MMVLSVQSLLGGYSCFGLSFIGRSHCIHIHACHCLTFLHNIFVHREASREHTRAINSYVPELLDGTEPQYEDIDKFKLGDEKDNLQSVSVLPPTTSCSQADYMYDYAAV